MRMVQYVRAVLGDAMCEGMHERFSKYFCKLSSPHGAMEAYADRWRNHYIDA